MKFIFLLGIILSFSAQAKGLCTLYEIKGIVRADKSDIRLVANEGSMSEFIFNIKIKDAHHFAPYLGVTTVGTYVFKKKVKTKDTIELIRNVNRSTPDPLNPARHSYVKELRAIECP